jgi:hypothetical protein
LSSSSSSSSAEELNNGGGNDSIHKEQVWNPWTSPKVIRAEFRTRNFFLVLCFFLSRELKLPPANKVVKKQKGKAKEKSVRTPRYPQEISFNYVVFFMCRLVKREKAGWFFETGRATNFFITRARCKKGEKSGEATRNAQTPTSREVRVVYDGYSGDGGGGGESVGINSVQCSNGFKDVAWRMARRSTWFRSGGILSQGSSHQR